MPWPVDDLSTADVDSGADTPPRAEFFKLFQRVKAIIGGRSTADGIASLDANRRVPDAELGRGVAGGVASLDGQGRVPQAQLPPQPVPVLWKPGDVKVHAGAGVEAGWLLCDGRAVSRNAYAALFAAIGTGWGQGDGATTFTLPDYSDRMILGASAARPVGTVGGEAEVTLTTDHVPEHTHPLSRTNAGAATGPASAARREFNNQVGTDKTGPAGGGQPHNNMPPFAAALVIIKT